MNTVEIDKIMAVNSKIFTGTYACDELPSLNSLQSPCSMILNDQPSTMPGNHWLLLYFEKNGHVIYFDSYGRPMLKVFQEYIGNQKCTKNNTQFQSIGSNYCGQYCILVALYLESGMSMKAIESCFNDSPQENDQFISYWSETELGYPDSTCDDTKNIISLKTVQGCQCMACA